MSEDFACSVAQGTLLSVIVQMVGKFGGKMDICVYVWLSCTAVHWKLSKLLISYIPISNKKFKKRENFADFGNNDQSCLAI